jgi:hypothetical protein
MHIYPKFAVYIQKIVANPHKFARGEVCVYADEANGENEREEENERQQQKRNKGRGIGPRPADRSDRPVRTELRS